ncbi:hypothetical protein O3P69_015492 [Scylla paramamosain]|uniref:Uncharacterized protein n=1 Tax=Scylla paramamosain TaxID=85552 RepID=A0AAW0T8M2_SCYPA
MWWRCLRLPWFYDGSSKQPTSLTPLPVAQQHKHTNRQPQHITVFLFSSASSITVRYLIRFALALIFPHLCRRRMEEEKNEAEEEGARGGVRRAAAGGKEMIGLGQIFVTHNMHGNGHPAPPMMPPATLPPWAHPQPTPSAHTCTTGTHPPLQ